MKGTVWRFVDWTVTPDVEPDAPRTLHQFRCLAEGENGKPCGAQSELSEEFETARGWTFRHFKAHQDHTSYAQVIERPWIMRMGKPI